MVKKKVPPEIASRVRQAILSKGQKLAPFSRESGMSYQSLMDYYNGSRKPGFEALALIVSYTGVDANWLLTGKGTMFPSGAEVQEQLMAHIVQVLAYAQHRMQTGAWNVQEGNPESYLYDIEENEVRTRLNNMGELAAMAANIYNRVAAITDANLQEAHIRQEVGQMLRLRQSLDANRLPHKRASNTKGND